MLNIVLVLCVIEKLILNENLGQLLTYCNYVQLFKLGGDTHKEFAIVVHSQKCNAIS